jgi:phospholipase C
MRLPTTIGLVSTLVLACAAAGAVADNGPGKGKDADDFRRIPTATPIKHLVVIFQENISFDHYFATYPNARNLSGETSFKASPRTPMVNNLANPLDVEHHFKPLKGIDLLNNNPNSNPNNPLSSTPAGVKNGTSASNPFRLSPQQALTADQGHSESPEESASDGGKMDGFPAFVGTAGPPPAG